ncbi:MAG: peptidylprolyl isomerase [Bacteroidota bacterium]
MIKNHYLYLVITFLIVSLILGCSKSTKENSNNTQKNKVEKKIISNTEKIKDPITINEKNVVSYLTEYEQKNPETQVIIKTRLGDIKIKLYRETPLHRANFIFLSKEGYFDTTCFYRVVPDFIIQGGNSENISTMRYRNKYQNYHIPAEFVKEYKHKYGAIAAARDWENNPTKRSTPFEFYIVQNKKGAHHLDGEHTVFGEVISGFSAVDKISNLKAGGDEWPLDDVFIKVEVIN